MIESVSNLLHILLHTGVGFFLNGTFLPNNSVVLLGDIGEGSNALFCLTNRMQCCSPETVNRGRWDFPPGGGSVHGCLHNCRHLLQ